MRPFAPTRAILLILIAGFATPGLAQNLDDHRSVTSGNWSDASTWERFDGTSFVPATEAPSNTNGAITIRNSHLVTVNASITVDEVVVETGGTLEMQSGELFVANGPNEDLRVLGGLVLSGGSLFGPGEISVAMDGSFTWTGGGVRTTAVLNLEQGSNAVFGFGGIGFLGNSGTINNAGTFTMTNGRLIIGEVGPGAFNNLATGVLNFNGANNSENSWEQNTTNHGVINKNITAPFGMHGTFVNNGAVNVATGELGIGATTTNNGTMTFAVAGTSLRIGGTFTNAATGVIIDPATLHVGGTFTSQSGGSISGVDFLDIVGLVFLESGSTCTSPSTITVSSGQLNHAMPFTVNALNLIGSGQLRGPGAITVPSGGGFTWTGGNVMPNAILNLEQGSNSVFSFGGFGFLGNNGTINNAGTFTRNVGQLIVGEPGPGAFNNLPTGVLTFNGGGFWTQNLTNHGTIDCNLAGVFDLNGIFVNNGAVNVATGELGIGATTTNNGTMTFAGAGTSLRIGGTFTNAATGVITDPATLHVGGTFTSQSGGSISGVDFLDIVGLVFLESGSTCTSPSTITVNSGQLNHAMPFTVNTLNLIGSGQLRGPGAITVPSGGSFTWTGGAVMTNAVLNLEDGSNSVFSFGGFGFLVNNGTINNAGTFTRAIGQLIIQDAGPGAFNNLPTGVLTFNGGGSWSQRITNQGVIQNNLAGNFDLNEHFNNLPGGLVNVNSGSLTITGPQTLAGKFMVAAGATLHSAQPFNFTGTEVENNGSITVQNLRFQGSAPQQLNGNGSIASMTLNGSGGVDIGGSPIITSTLTLSEGMVRLGANDLVLTNSSAGAISGGSAASHVVTDGTGSLRRPVNGAGFVFPVGTAGSYTPATLSLTAGPSEEFLVRVQPGVSTEYGTPGEATGSTLANDVVGRTWVIQEITPGGTTADVTLEWSATDEGAGFDRTNSLVAAYNGSDWVSGAAGPASGSGPYSRQTTGVIAFREFTVADEDAPLNEAALDCNGVPGGAAGPGSPCNDNDPCTINDVFDAECNCVGNFTDSDNDGVCDALDNCPNLAGQQGSPCDDGDPATVNDTIDGDCACVGQLPSSIALDYDPVGLCADGLQFNVPYTATGTFGPGNVFTLELSDANGSFANPVVVGTLVSDNTSDVISGAIPGNTPFGNQYRLRITSSVPAVTSAPNATDIIMLQLVNWYADVDGDGLGDPDNLVFACIPPDPSYVNNGDDPCPLLANVSPGNACDDGNPNTVNDAIDFDCNCVGEGVPTLSIAFEPAILCSDNTFNYLVQYSATGSFDPGNNWVLELSDASGSFVAPTVLGVLGSAGLSGDIVGNIPTSTPNGVGYRLRVRSTSPEVISNDNGEDLTVENPILWYADNDVDGFGDPNISILACFAPIGYVGNNMDCNDGDPTINPAAADPCDGIDNDCNTLVDEDYVTENCIVCNNGQLVDQSPTWYADADGDGFGDPSVSQLACTQPNGFVANNTDCNDGDETAFPGAPCTNGDPCIVGETLDANCNCTGGTSTATTNTTNQTACTFYTWAVNGETYTTAGTYTVVNGCTTEVLNLTLTGCSVCGTSSPTVCGTSYFWNISGQTYTESGTYVWSNETGCTVITLNLTLITPFSACDDANPNTVNDTYDANCNCVGQVLDCNGDAGGTASIDACGVCSGGNTGITPNSSCLDCNGVPNGPAIPGSACDDGNANTTNDTWTAGCLCQGTPVAGTSTVVLELRTNNTYDQVTWEILGSNNSVACSGGPYSALINAPITEFCQLANDCYRLRVFDSGGDGFGAGGGYQLRLPGSYPLGTPLANNVLRIIDNFGNFTSGSLSAMGGGPNAFCLPLSSQAPIFASRDKLDWVNAQYIVAETDGDVSSQWLVGDQTDDGYEFWFFDPNGSYSFRRFRNHATSDGFANVGATRACHARINGWLASNHIPANRLMNVRIRARVNGTNKAWGPAFRFMIDPVAAACPRTKLLDDPNNPFLSCNQTRNWGSNNYIHARPVSGANRYQFRFRIADEGFNRVITSTSYMLQLNWATQPLVPGATYDVDVRISKDGGVTWCVSGASWGESCKLTIAASNGQGNGDNLAMPTTEGGLSLWPNPNNGELLTLSLSGIAEGVQTVAVDIFNLTGKRVVSREVAVSDGPSSPLDQGSGPLGEGRNGGSLYTVLELNGELATGVYLVSLTAGSERYTQRLVVGR